MQHPSFLAMLDCIKTTENGFSLFNLPRFIRNEAPVKCSYETFHANAFMQLHQRESAKRVYLSVVEMPEAHLMRV